VLSGLVRNSDPSMETAKFGEASDWDKLPADLVRP
jgi:hypothetical protein